MLINTKAIVLRHVDFSETSRIITVFSRDKGKFAIMIKGFRRPKSKYAGIISYGSILDLIVYYKQSRSVQSLKEADTAQSILNIRSDFGKMAIIMALLELLDLSTHEHESNPELFDFLEKFLFWLNETELSAKSLFPYLQLRVAELNGVGLQYDVNDLTSVCWLNIIEGSVSDTQHSGLAFKLKSSQKEYIRIAMQGGTKRLLNIELSKLELKELINHLDVYLKHHIDGLRDRKSDLIFEQILDS